MPSASRIAAVTSSRFRLSAERRVRCVGGIGQSFSDTFDEHPVAKAEKLWKRIGILEDLKHGYHAQPPKRTRSLLFVQGRLDGPQGALIGAYRRLEEWVWVPHPTTSPSAGLISVPRSRPGALSPPLNEKTVPLGCSAT